MLESILESILIDLSHGISILRKIDVSHKIAYLRSNFRVRFSESSSQLALKIRWLRDLSNRKLFQEREIQIRNIWLNGSVSIIARNALRVEHARSHISANR